MPKLLTYGRDARGFFVAYIDHADGTREERPLSAPIGATEQEAFLSFLLLVLQMKRRGEL